jgi:hypothetical protein
MPMQVEEAVVLAVFHRISETLAMTNSKQFFEAGMFTEPLCQKHIKIFKQYQHTLTSKFNGVNLSDTEQSIIGGKKVGLDLKGPSRF